MLGSVTYLQRGERMTRQAGSLREWTDEALLQRLQSILIEAAEGRRELSADRQYPGLRKELARRSLDVPPLVATHPTVDSVVAYIKGFDRSDRAKLVRDQFEPILSALEDPAETTVDPTAWGAPPSETSRLRTVRSLLPLAQAAVDSMITTLSEPNPNGAPILDDRKEAIEHLRDLHHKLGELLSAVDNGHFGDALGQGLLAEAARYAKRAARALRDDPMPYLASGLLLGVFEACGLPGISGYIAGIALNIRKHSDKA